MKIVYRSIYDGVFMMRDKNLKQFWVMKYRHNRKGYIVPCMDERDAALKYDLKMMSLGNTPTNIYKQKL